MFKFKSKQEWIEMYNTPVILLCLRRLPNINLRSMIVYSCTTNTKINLKIHTFLRGSSTKNFTGSGHQQILLFLLGMHCMGSMILLGAMFCVYYCCICIRSLYISKQISERVTTNLFNSP